MFSFNGPPQGFGSGTASNRLVGTPRPGLPTGMAMEQASGLLNFAAPLPSLSAPVGRLPTTDLALGAAAPVWHTAESSFLHHHSGARPQLLYDVSRTASGTPGGGTTTDSASLSQGAGHIMHMSAAERRRRAVFLAQSLSASLAPPAVVTAHGAATKSEAMWPITGTRFIVPPRGVLHGAGAGAQAEAENLFAPFTFDYPANEGARQMVRSILRHGAESPWPSLPLLLFTQYTCARDLELCLDSFVDVQAFHPAYSDLQANCDTVVAFNDLWVASDELIAADANLSKYVTAAATLAVVAQSMATVLAGDAPPSRTLLLSLHSAALRMATAAHVFYMSHSKGPPGGGGEAREQHGSGSGATGGGSGGDGSGRGGVGGDRGAGSGLAGQQADQDIQRAMREAQARGLTLTVDQNRELRMLQDLVRVWPETPSQGTVLARQCVKLGLASGPCTTPVAVKALFREHLQGVLLRVQALMASGTAKQYHAAGSAASLMSAQPSLAAVLLLHPKRAAKLQKATTLLASADDLRRYVKDAVRPLLPHLGPAARTTLGLFLSSVETLGFSPWGGGGCTLGVPRPPSASSCCVAAASWDRFPGGRRERKFPHLSD